MQWLCHDLECAVPNIAHVKPGVVCTFHSGSLCVWGVGWGGVEVVVCVCGGGDGVQLQVVVCMGWDLSFMGGQWTQKEQHCK